MASACWRSGQGRARTSLLSPPPKVSNSAPRLASAEAVGGEALGSERLRSRSLSRWGRRRGRKRCTDAEIAALPRRGWTPTRPSRAGRLLAARHRAVAGVEQGRQRPIAVARNSPAGAWRRGCASPSRTTANLSAHDARRGRCSQNSSPVFVFTTPELAADVGRASAWVERSSWLAPPPRLTWMARRRCVCWSRLRLAQAEILRQCQPKSASAPGLRKPRRSVSRS